jgi:predicted metalloprotease with PDZ domain
MKIKYLLQIEDPQNSILKIKISASRKESDTKMNLYMPNWSPGSYLIRDYARNIRVMQAFDSNGKELYLEQTSKNKWIIDWENQSFLSSNLDFFVEYEVYCHELTVRTSHIDISHAFLHGPSIFVMFEGAENHSGEVQVDFPGLWSCINTALKEISTKRDGFIYEYENFDELLDSPFEIGCQETDGFKYKDKNHYIASYGKVLNGLNFKPDLEKIVETVASVFNNDLPYEDYHFILHFKKGLYGGLEHHDSCACQFDPMGLSIRKEYLNFLSLMAHEYFHTWNIKRIRPKELGPFDYNNENYTRMLWLAEGLTSFMDDLFIYRAGFSSLDEYLEIIKKNLNIYHSIPGRKFHSLADSSFNAWVKLYKRDENTNNTSVSYYLKGGLVFMVLNFLLMENKSSINDLIAVLWNRYKDNPSEGMTKEEFLTIIENLSNKDVVEKFDVMLTTNHEIDFEKFFIENGMQYEWEETIDEDTSLGIKYNYVGEQVFVQSVLLDSSSYKSGINPKDELIAIDGIRVSKSNLSDIEKALKLNKNYNLLISRLGELTSVELTPEKKVREIKSIKVVDKEKAEKIFK